MRLLKLAEALNAISVARIGAYSELSAWTRLYSIIFILLLGQSHDVCAYEINSTVQNGNFIGPDLLFYEDGSNSLGIETIRELEDDQFFVVDKLVPGFGSTRSTYWARLVLDNKLSQPIKIFVEFNYLFADVIEFYHDSSAGLVKVTAGDRQTRSRLAFKHRLPMTQFELESGAKLVLHIKVVNEGFMQFPVKIWSEREFHDNRMWEAAFVVSLVIIITVMLLYNAFIYLTTRESVLPVYLAFLTINLFCQLPTIGAARWLNLGWVGEFWSNSGYLFLTNAAFILSLIVCQKFLEVSPKQNVSRLLLAGTMGIGFFTMGLVPLSYAHASKAASLYGLLSMAVVFGLSLVRCWKGQRSAYFFMLAWFGVIICVVIQQLYFQSVVHWQIFGFGALIGTAAESILISLAIGDKMRTQIQKALLDNHRYSQEIVEKEKARTIFFHNASHELRTPLNGIIGFLELLLRGRYGAINDSMREHLEKTRRLAEGLKNQVNTILDLAKVKRGELRLQPTRFALEELKSRIDDLSEGLRLGNKSVGYRSEVKLKSGEPFLHLDKEKVIAICRNLIGNAFKFADPKRANEVSVRLELEGKTLWIQVRDQGIGIPEEQQQRIFEDFAQVESDARRSYEGSGLGLAIVRDFVQLMGGRIEVRSQLGQGAEFNVFLPEAPDFANQEGDLLVKFAPQDSHKPEPSSELHNPPFFEESVHISRSIRQKFSILVVDDHEVNCEVVHDLLTHEGYQSQFVLNAREALTRLRDEKFDLLLLDVMMPEMSGEDLLRIIRADEELRNLPVIMITARASDEDRLKGLNLGADDYVAKPINGQELLLRVQNILKRIDEASRRSDEDSQIQMRQLGEVFAFTSHEIKNIFNNVDTSLQVTGKDLREIVALFELPEDVTTVLLEILNDSIPKDSLQACLDVLPKVPPGQGRLRALRADLAYAQIPIKALPRVWETFTQLTEAKRDALHVIIRWIISYKQLSFAVSRSHDIFIASLSLVRGSRQSESRLKQALEPILSLMSIRAQKEGVVFQYDFNDVLLSAQAQLVQQVVLNLLGNAFDEIKKLPLAERRIRLWVDHEPGFALLKVSNAGSPLSEGVQAKLFQRGYTSKGEKGHGIGLYLSRKLAKECGGDLYYDGSQGEICFVLQLPLVVDGMLTREGTKQVS